MAESIEQLSLELSANALAEQERAFSGLRMCASTVLGTASVAGSFLGARALRGSVGVLSVLALISFGRCFASAVWVLRPYDLAFALRGGALLAPSGDCVDDIREAHRAAAAWIEMTIDVNSRKLTDLSMCLTASCVALAAEIILWTLGIIG